MRTMRMEREDIENSLKVLSHIVDDDFIITVEEARKIIGIDGETIEALQDTVQAQDKALKECARQLAKMQKRNAELHAELEKWVSAAEKAGEPKRGKWIGVSPMVDTVQCSVCGGQLFSAELETPYCPYCGAEMEETEDGANR